jgi:type VI secretion system secreted protein Hcp
MAVDMFVKIEGPEIKGEARDTKHKEEIDVLAWSWGVSNSGSAHVGGGAGAGKCNVQDLSFTKYVDSASHALLLSACNGQHHDKVTLVVRKAGTTPVEYITIVMEEVLVTAISTGGSGGEDRLTENVTLNFAKFKYSYVPQDAKGAALPAKESGWNIAENVVA